jgi:hypothetical protein
VISFCSTPLAASEKCFDGGWRDPLAMHNDSKLEAGIQKILRGRSCSVDSSSAQTQQN